MIRKHRPQQHSLNEYQLSDNQQTNLRRQMYVYTSIITQKPENKILRITPLFGDKGNFGPVVGEGVTRPLKALTLTQTAERRCRLPVRNKSATTLNTFNLHDSSRLNGGSTASQGGSHGDVRALSRQVHNKHQSTHDSHVFFFDYAQYSH